MKNEGIFVGRDMSYLFSFYVLCTYSAVNQYEQRKLKLKHFVHKVNSSYSNYNTANTPAMLNLQNWDHSFSTYAKFSEKQTFLTYVCVSRVRSVRFSEYFAHVLNK